MSEYMLSLICMDRSAYALAETGAVLHYLKMPALIAGFLFFPLSRALDFNIRVRRSVFVALNVIYIAGMSLITGIIPVGGLPAYIISCIISLLALGFLGGAVYYYMAMGFVGHPYTGRLSGLGGAAAFLIQMAALYLISSALLIFILLLAGFFFTVYSILSSRETTEWMFDEPLEYAQKNDSALPGKNKIASGMAAMLLLYMICGMTDTILVSMNFSGDMSMYAWPRLFGAVGYILGGFLADIDHRKWLHTAAFCMTILCIPIPLILNEGYTTVGTCIYYVIVVGQIVYLNVFFWDLAPKTAHPELWAGMSRVLSGATVIILPLFSGASIMTAIIFEVVFTAAAMVLIVLGGYFPIYESPAAAEPDESNIAADPMMVFSGQYRLTPRETQILSALLESDDDIQSISSSLDITTRTVYRHLNNIYEKTGTSSRHSLMRLYYESKEASSL